MSVFVAMVIYSLLQIDFREMIIPRNDRKHSKITSKTYQLTSDSEVDTLKSVCRCGLKAVFLSIPTAADCCLLGAVKCGSFGEADCCLIGAVKCGSLGEAACCKFGEAACCTSCGEEWCCLGAALSIWGELIGWFITCC